jgi:DNA-directed RNA polymerase specialized sigma24 family protein
MARCSSTGTTSVHAERDASPEDPFEPHLRRIALFCLRVARDPAKAAALAERVLGQAREKLASSRGAPSFSGWLYSILREECLPPAHAKCTVATRQPLHAGEDVP